MRLEVPRAYALLLDVLGPTVSNLAAARRAAVDDLAAALTPAGEPAREAALRSHLAGGARWPPLLELAREHFLLPALWPALRRHGAVDAVPESLRRHLSARASRNPVPVELTLEDLHRANAERNHALRLQVEGVVALLRRAGIEPVLLKGAALLLADGSDLGERQLRDLDLLVAEESIDTAVDVLRAAGYAPSDDAGVDESRPRSLGWYRRSHHHYCPLVQPGAPAPIELHWALGSGAVNVALPAARVRRDAVPAPAVHWRGLVPSPRDQLLHLMLHAEVSDFGHRRAILPLRALHDLTLLCRQHGERVPWVGVAEALDEAGLTRVGAAFVASAERLLALRPSLPGPLVPDRTARRHTERCIANASLPPGWRRRALALRGRWLMAFRRRRA